MKSITFIVGNYKNGGVPMRATNLANEFGRRGYKVKILVTKGIAKEIFFELHENVELISLNQYVENNQGNLKVIQELAKQKKKIKRYKRMRYMSRFFSKWDADLEQKVRKIRKGSALRVYLVTNESSVVIPFGLSYYEQVFYASRGLDYKIIYAERNAPELEVPKNPVRASQLLKILGQADGAIFQTNAEKEFYKKYVCKNVAVIHNPIKKGLPKTFCGERRKVIVNYCRIAEQKNLKLLVDAFALVYKEYPEYTLEIYGNAVEDSEEMLRLDLEKYVVKLGLSECIRILPPVADVHERVKDCAMFVSSSDFEGLSNSMIEAMAIGLPCVCTDCLGGGARELIINGKNGLLVPMKDKEVLYKGIKKMIENPEFAQLCGEYASKITEKMSVERIADKWLEVIENV